MLLSAKKKHWPDYELTILLLRLTCYWLLWATPTCTRSGILSNRNPFPRRVLPDLSVRSRPCNWSDTGSWCLRTSAEGKRVQILYRRGMYVGKKPPCFESKPKRIDCNRGVYDWTVVWKTKQNLKRIIAVECLANDFVRTNRCRCEIRSSTRDDPVWSIPCMAYEWVGVFSKWVECFRKSFFQTKSKCWPGAVVFSFGPF